MYGINIHNRFFSLTMHVSRFTNMLFQVNLNKNAFPTPVDLFLLFIKGVKAGSQMNESYKQ